MNIFYLDTNPRIAAEQHTDKHVVKMIVETAQMLSTAHRILEGESMETTKSATIYKTAYQNHPCTVWVRKSDKNYEWAFELFKYLLLEYTHRFDKHHSAERLLPYLSQLPSNISSIGFTPPAMAMPDDYKHSNPVVAYRTYYFYEKGHLFSWKKRDLPSWLVPTNEDSILKPVEGDMV
jgi:hypothetical protein